MNGWSLPNANSTVWAIADELSMFPKIGINHRPFAGSPDSLVMRLARAVEAELARDPVELLSEFGRIHTQLRQDAGARAADAVMALIRPKAATEGGDHVSH